MRSVLRIAGPVLLSVLLLGSCNKAWRGDGPPEQLAGTEWIGTNQARGEVLDMVFGLDGEYSVDDHGDGSSYETGTMKLLFSFPAGDTEERDTIVYNGTYTYSRTPTGVPGDVPHGNADFALENTETGETVKSGMSFHNRRFYVSFKGSSYPADRAEDSWISNVR